MTQDMISRSVAELTRKAKTIYGNKLKEVILFGSCARGDYTDESDIDVMILLDYPIEELGKERVKISRLASQIDMEFGYEILLAPVIQSYMVYSKYLSVLPFYQNVDKEGIRYAG